MRPVNLLPPELRSRGAGDGDPRVAYGIVGGLGVLLLMVLATTFYSNKITTVEDQTTAIRAEAQRYQVKAKPVQSFNDFADVVQKRTLLVGGLAESRFPWDSALRNLSRSMPEDVTLDSITTASESGDAASSPSANNVSMELKGCVATWVGMSRLTVRMRNMPGVKDVAGTDSSSENAEGGESGANGGESQDADAKRKRNCGLRPVIFGLKVIYEPQTVDLIGLPKIDSGTPAAGATAATGVAPATTPASAPASPGAGG